MKEGIKKGLTILAVLALLVVSYWWGGNSPLLHGWKTSTKPVMEQTIAPSEHPKQAVEQQEVVQQEESPKVQPTEQIKENDPKDEGSPAPASTPPTGGMTAEEKMQAAAELAQTGGIVQRGQFNNGPVPEGKPQPVDQQTVSDTSGYCTLFVSCETLLQHKDWLPKEKWGLIPEDGVILPATQVLYYEGESVFHVLRRELKKAGIHLEFNSTPVFKSAYIEGINNLYEFDCGELSGWMYSVNDWFPNYGCSRYQIQSGDVIRFIYSCELGVDTGGY